VALGKAAHLFKAGDHGSTFGGNPISTAAAIAAIKVIEKEKIFLNVKKIGEFLRSEIALIPGVTETRGAGLLIGVTLEGAIAKKVVKKCESLGLLINAPSESYLRIAPALNVSERQAEQCVKILHRAIAEVKNG
jgi:acetylornithine/N-succinyldiaminopimelate aminotransferase